MKKRILSFVLTLLLLSGAVSTLLSLPVAADLAPSGGRKQKVIAVVYDNSGSMSQENRDAFAKYAAQSLIALVDPGDTLYFVPINPTNQSGNKYKVDLTADRAETVINVATQSFFNANGISTPGASIGTGVATLVGEGMKKNEDVVSTDGDDKEYWLVVLTDGAFDGPGGAMDFNKSSADALLEQYAYGYSGLRTVYLGFGSAAQDLSSSALQSKMPFTAFKITQSNEVIKAMQQIACLLTGRLAIDQKYVSVSGSTVTVDLNGCEYPISSISVIAQNCDAEMTSAAYNGTKVRMQLGSTITPAAQMNMKAGYSVVLKNASDDVPFDKGTLTLQYSNAVSADNVTVLVEPALELVPIVEYKEESDWAEVDSQYINEFLSPGDTVRVKYRVVDRLNNVEVDLGKIFGELKENVTYAGESFDPNEEFTLLEGRNEITVSVELVKTTYKLYGSVFCNVEPDPTNFRIEKKVTAAPNGDKNLTRIDYTVYLDGSPASPETLRNNHFEWKAVATDNSGASLPVQCETDADRVYAVVDTGGMDEEYFTVKFTVISDATVAARDARMRSVETKVYSPKLTVQSQVTNTAKDDSWHKRVTYELTEGTLALSAEEVNSYQWTVSVVGEDGTECPADCKVENGNPVADFDLTPMKNGFYTVTFTIQSAHGPVQDVQRVKRSPASMTVNLVKNDCAHVTEHKFLENQRAIVFSVVEGKNPVALDDTLNMAVTVNGTDVTKYVTVKGNEITYVPLPEHFSGGREIHEGTFKVEVNVSYKEDTSVCASESTEINVSNSVFTIEPVQGTNHDVNRFKITDSQAQLDFMILRDGEPLSSDELQALADNNEIQYKNTVFGGTMFWSLSKRIVTVEDNNGSGILNLKYENRMPKLLRPIQGLLAMLIWKGEKQVTVSYGGAEASDSLNVLPSAIWEYVWRLVLLYLFIYLVHWIIGFFVCKSFNTGAVVGLALSGNNPFVNCEPVNATFSQKMVRHLHRLIPFHLFAVQDDFPANMVTLHIDKDSGSHHYPTIQFDFSEYQTTGNALFRLVPSTDPEANSIRVIADQVRDYLNDPAGSPEPSWNTKEMGHSQNVRNIMNVVGEPLDSNIKQPCSEGTYYGIMNMNTHRLTYVVFYVNK